MTAEAPSTIRVLHVDDEPAFADLVAAALEREDGAIEVVTAHGAGEGRDALDGTIDCVVSDYRMPGTDGLEFLESVRADHPDLPFILFTGEGSEEIASRAISAGVTDYLQKGGGDDQYTVLANRIRNAVARHRAEKRVERGFHALATAREGVSLLDPDGYFTYVNDAFCDVVGYDREELLGEHWELLYPEDDVEDVYEELLPSIPAEGRWTGETVYVRGDGERILVDHALSVCEEGSMICLITALSGDRRDDGPLVAEDAFVECVLDALDDVFYVLDREGNIVRVNERAVEVTGYDRGTLTSMHAREVFVPEDRDRVDAGVRETLEAGVTAYEFDLLTADGEERPHEFRTRRLEDGAGETVGLVGIGRDVTERRDRERRLERQTQQFEAFGSVLAHDLRTPLATLEGRLQLARETREEEHFAAAEAALERLDTLIEDLADVMREGRLTDEPTVVDLGAVARSTWETLGTADASLVVAEGGSIRADEGALVRLLENLFRNGVEHGGDGVTVRVGTLPDGFYVADDGPGIPPGDRDDVFEPGFTAKEEGGGFGMTSVRQIALAHGWSVGVTESEDGGARFEFTDVRTA